MTSRHGVGVILMVICTLAASGAAARPHVTAAAWVQSNDQVTSVAPAGFAAPPPSKRPGVFYWWPDPQQLDDSRIRQDIHDMASVGFGGAKMVTIPITPGASVNGWGGPTWREHVKQALLEARRDDVRLDLAIGPEWPISAPTITPDLSMQSLLYAVADIPAAGFSGRVPQPAGVVGTKHLVAVTAANLIATDPQTQSTTLDPDSALDLTSQVGTDQTLTFHPPAAGQWLLFAFWQRATGQTVPVTSFPSPSIPELLARPVTSTPDAWLIPDYFSKTAATVALNYLGQAIAEGGLADLLREEGANIHEDSLELKGDVLWTSQYPAEFAARRGYDLARYLPALLIPGNYTGRSFEFTGTIGDRVRHDYHQTLTDLYIDNHLQVEDRWAAANGLTFRAQAGYFSADELAPRLDITRSAAAVDTPETETLSWGDPAAFATAQWQHALDGYRLTASGAHQSGHNEVSVELGDALFHAYGQNPLDYKELIDKVYIGGINQIYVHGVAYPDAPGGPAQAGYGWPGWSPFEFGPFAIAGISEAWNANYPQWKDWSALTTYMARARTVLESGSPGVDLAVYHDGGVNPHGSEPVFGDRSLQNHGYTYDYISAPNLTPPLFAANANNRTASTPRYRALVIDNQPNLTLAAVGAITTLAEQGTPLVITGSVPTQSASARDPLREDPFVQHAVTKLLSLPNVRHVQDENQVAGALEELHVIAAAAFPAPTNLLTTHRVSPDADYWFIANPTDRTVSAQPTLASVGTPYALDLWNGETTPMASWTATELGTQVPLALPPHGSTVIAIKHGPAHAAVTHAAAAPSPDLLYRGGQLFARSTTGGTVTVNLSDGTSHQVPLDIPPSPMGISQWLLEVTEALPTGSATHQAMLDQLQPWTTIPGLYDASGSGEYTATVTLPTTWFGPGRGVFIDVGDLQGAMTLRVNGIPVTLQDTPGGQWDVTGDLHAGSNRVTVTIATTLRNRILALAKSGDPRYTPLGNLQHQDYGLLGPVQLVPFTEAAVTGR